MVIFVRTDEGQPRPKYIFNKCGTAAPVQKVELQKLE